MDGRAPLFFTLPPTPRPMTVTPGQGLDLGTPGVHNLGDPRFHIADGGR